MRVLFVSNLYPPHEMGGMEQLCKETVDGFKARGHVCHVLTSRYGLRGKPQPEVGVKRALYLQADVNYYRPLDFFLRRPWRERANRRALREAVETFQPEIIFVWGMWNLEPLVAYWAERWLPGCVAYAVAGYWPMEPGAHVDFWREPANRRWTEALKTPLRRLALDALTREKAAHPLSLQHVACVSEYVRGKLSDAGVLPHGARVIYNGIDPKPFTMAVTRSRPALGGLRLIYVGGLVSHKGVLTAIEAMGLLLTRGDADGLHLEVVGGGHPDYVALLERRVRELGIDAFVTFRGRVPRSEIASLLAGQDVFLFTSVYEEPIARSVMEAMAAGLAVIGTPVGGQQEMLEDGQNALVFQPEDAAGLADCIRRLQCDPSLRARVARAGRQTVLLKFTLGRMVDEMETWCRDLINIS